MVRIWFVAADLAKRRVDEVRVRVNYSIGIRKERGQYYHVLCPSLISLPFILLSEVQ